MKKLIGGVFLALLLMPAIAQAYTPPDKASVPEVKHSDAGLYLTAPEAYEMKSKAADKVVFIDIRTRGEFQFLGTTSVTDKNIPYVEMDDPSSWDKKNARYTLVPNSDFVAAVDAVVAKRNLGKSDTIILMCRSGDRSAPASNLLLKAGYTKVYSVLDGFEGDLNKTTGHRDINGWKNANLPWSYNITADQAYLR